MLSTTSGYAFLDVSRSGTLVYAPGYQRGVDRSIVWVDRTGRMSPLSSSRRPYRDPALSPDGRRLAVSIEGPSNDDIWIYDLGRDAGQRLTTGGDNRFPIWSPDGKRVVFQSNRGGALNLFQMPAAGGEAPEPLTEGHAWHVVPDSFSPDGHFMVHASNDSGRNEIYVRPFPGLSQKWQVSKEGGGGGKSTAPREVPGEPNDEGNDEPPEEVGEELIPDPEE